MPDPVKAPVTPAPAPAAATATAPAPVPVPAHAAPSADVTPSLVETLKHLEQRSRPAGYASATPGLDEAGEKGPVYLVKGRRVNAHGREVNEDGSLVHPEQQQVDIYGRLT